MRRRWSGTNAPTVVGSPPSDQTDTTTRLARRLEFVSTVLLTLATVATAWAAYQSRQWTGEQSQGYSRATASRIAVNRFSALANRQVQIDVATFIQWVDAHAEGRTALATFYRRRFRPDFEPAFAAWIATKPFTNPAAAPTPFALPGYKLRASEQADRLEARAAVASQQAKDANQHADDYMLAVVLFATALFFAGLSTKLHSTEARVVTLVIGCIVFLGSAIWTLTLPAHLTT